MADDPATIDLTLTEIRAITGYAGACALPALEILERVRPDDPRPREAVDAARAFADGAARIKSIRDHAWAPR